MKLLYAEDEDHIRELVDMALELDGGIELESVNSGRAAIDRLRGAADLPDAVLLDVMMPGLDGPATLAAMRADPRLADLPVVFFTAKGRKDEHAVLTALGAVGVIAKPFDPLSLADQLRAILDRAHES